jgi:hypothetical protein
LQRIAVRSLRGVLLATLAVSAGLLGLAQAQLPVIPLLRTGELQLATSEAGVIEPETFINEGPEGLVNTNDVSFRFSSDTGTSFECDLDGGGFGACTSPADYFNLSEGSHTFQVRAINDLTAVPDQTPAGRSFTVDTVAPNTTIDSGPSGTTGSPDASFSFSSNDLDATFECKLDSGSWGSCSSPKEYTGLSSTSHTFSVRATDPAGNTDPSPPQRTWTVDTTPPTTTISSGTTGPTNSTSASFAFAASESGSVFECQLDLGAWEPCTSSKSYSGLGEGPHTFRVRATDGAGNVDPSPAERSWTIDVTPPDTSITAGPSGTVTSSSATFEFSSTEADSTFECRLDSGSWTACGATSSKTYNGLPDGSHTFRVRATDNAGNTDLVEATRTWSVDAAAPTTSIDQGPSGTVNSTSANFKFSSSEAGSTFECQLDGGAWASCSSPQHYNNLAEQSHTFSVRATDSAGNTDPSPPIRTWSIDVTPPDTSITSGPTGNTTATSANFQFTSTESGSTFECQLDGGGWFSCTSPKSYTPGDGSHTFAVRATDSAGNVDPTETTRSWTIDSTPPVTTILTHPNSPTTSPNAGFDFSSSEPNSTFQCKLDSGAWEACGSPKIYTSLFPGSHTFQVQASDALGNTDPSPDSFTWTIDQTAPDSTINSGPGMVSGSNSAQFTFSSTEASTFQCQLDGGGWQGCSSPKTYSSLPDGSHTFEVRATDQAGNTDASPDSHTWSIVTTTPDTFIDSGPDGPTPDNKPTFTFHSDEPGATFECKLDGPGGAGSYGSCTSPKSYSTPLADGSYTFSVRAANAVANVDQTPATRSFSVDTTPPNTSISTGPQGTIGSDSATFEFTSTEPGSTFKCKLALDEDVFTPCTSPKSYSGLSEGAHTFQVVAIDQFGHEDATPASRTFTVDTTAPDTSITAGPSGSTTDDTPTFEFSGTTGTAGFECRFDSEPFAACASPYTRTTGLTNGPHVFEVRAKDAVGNIDASPASRPFTVNTAGTNTFINASPPVLSNDTTPTFSFSSNEAGASFDCDLTGPGQTAGYTSCISPITYGPLTDGSYTFSVQATSSLGTDQTPATSSFTVDTAAPQTTISTGPTGTVNTNAASFSFTSSEAGSTFQCKLDAQPFSPCSSPASYGGLSDGQHTFRVRAIDGAGNTDLSEATRTWTADTGVPETVITSGPSGPTSDATPTFEFSSEANATFKCRLDGPGTTAGSYSDCTSGLTYNTPLAPGNYIFYVFAIDSAGTPDPTPASSPFTVDTGAPQTTISTGPTGTVNTNAASFTFASSEAGSTFQCKLDGQAFASCTSPVSYGLLGEGSHTFRVKATDPAGNTDATEATRTWTVDTVAPETSITSSPTPFIKTNSATFTFSSPEGGTTFQCKLDQVGTPTTAYAACPSSKQFTGLVDGSYTFSVYAVDAGGNFDSTPATSSFTVDTVKPVTSLLTRPLQTTNEKTATFTFSSETGAAFECRLTGPGFDEVFAACSSPVTYTNLLDGSYTFGVRAIDQAGNTDTSAIACPDPSTPSGPCNRYAWTVDTTLPQTTIDSSPSNPTNSTSATFSFSSTADGASFECKLDGAGAWSPCSSPETFTGLSEGQHTFSVRAKDPAGNVDPVPATRTWRVDLTSPETAIHSGPSGATTSSSATFGFSSSESGSSFQCRIDGGEWGQCSSPKVYADLQLGGHTFEVRAIDGAANVDASPAKRTWSVNASPAALAASGPSLLSPFPVVRISGKFTSRGVLLRLFQISVRDGMKVVIRCAPRRLCPFARHSRTATRGLKYQVRSAKFIRVRRLERRLLRAGIKLEVFITKPGLIGKYTRFKIRKSKPPRRTDRCLPPNSSKPVACPS